MTLPSFGPFTHNIVDLPDIPSDTLGPADIKAWFDSRGIDLQTFINSLISILNNTSAGASGARNIGSESIVGLVGNDVYNLLVALKNYTDATKQYLQDQIVAQTLGQIPDNAITDAKMAVGNKPGLLINLPAEITARDNLVEAIGQVYSMLQSFNTVKAATLKLDPVNSGPTLNNNLGDLDLKDSTVSTYKSMNLKNLTITDGQLFSKIGVTTYTIIDAQARVWRAVYNDLAELFLKGRDEIEPGDVVMIGESGVIKARGYGNPKVVGVYSDTFGMCLGGEEKATIEENLERYIPVGISGRVLIKVSGTIEPGDLLCSSEIPGVAAKSYGANPGTIIGKAMEPHSGEEISRIWALIVNA